MFFVVSGIEAAPLTEMSGDGGVDVIAHTDALGFQPPIIKIQCKRQTNPVTDPEVSQLLGSLGEGEFALFVTLGTYSRQSIMRERTNSRLRLIDARPLVELVYSSYQKMSPRYRRIIPLRQIYVSDHAGERLKPRNGKNEGMQGLRPCPPEA